MKTKVIAALFLLTGVALSGLAFLGSANQQSTPKSGPKKEMPRAKRLAGTCPLTNDEPTWVEPTTHYPVKNRTFVRLHVQEAVSTIGKDRVRHRSYNGAMVGPVIRTRPGNKLFIHLVNSLPVTSADIDPPLNRKDLQFVQVPHGFNSTNLHTHGLHVSPKEPSDAVFLEIDPLVKKEYRYSFDIPPDHPAGTYWYHAHKHGSVALQLSNGMAGALIVEGGLDDYHGLKGVKERIMVFQQINYRPVPDGPATIFAQDIYSGYNFPANPPPPPLTTTTLINGQLCPIITMRPGEIQRWRMIHAGLSSSIHPHLEDHTFSAIAFDGIPLKNMHTLTKAELEPGYRVDVLVQASFTEGTYCLYNDVANATTAFRGVTVAAQPIAKIIVEGEKCDMTMPDPAKMADWVANLINTKNPQLKDIAESEITGTRELTFQHDNLWAFYVDGKTFNPTRFDQQIEVGKVEKWKLSSISDQHPFHIHVNPFQVENTFPDGTAELVWRDTILLQNKQSITMRTRFLDFDGTTVLHCHNLEHEDRGMMQAIKLMPKVGAGLKGPATTVADLPNLPRAAPDWSLKTTNGQNVQCKSYKGRNLLLVFHRGLDCLHCSEQLTVLAKEAAHFRALGVEIAAISPRWPREAEVKSVSKQLGIEFPLLADPTLAAFRSYGCYDQQPLHGLFLLDVSGQVRWQSVSVEAETDVQRLVDLIRSHLSAASKPPQKTSASSTGGR
jgi:FtsP/CotA-like multicopper oxidase with cupredoxin domain/peroxiredoxin